jgi:TRAP-type mannitol/chloroaromatic compound transport system permease small subunit
LEKILNVIDTINDKLGKMASYLILVIIAIVCFEVFMRYFLNKPTVWVFELSSMTFGAYIVLAGGFTYYLDAHVRMDLLYSKLSVRRKALLDVVTFIFTATFCLALIWKGAARAQFAIMNNESSNSIWDPSLIPIKVILPVGACFLLLQAIVKFIRDLRRLFGKKIPESKEVEQS